MTYEDGQAVTSRWLGAAGLRPGHRVLDLGCGPGNLTRLVFDHTAPGGQVVGIDRNTAYLEAARAQHAGRDASFLAADLSDPLPGELGDFDAVVLRRVLMYLPDPARLLREAARRLRPGGVMFVQELIFDEPPPTLPLHREVVGWLRRMLEHEGASSDLGRRLPQVFLSAGLPAPTVRAEIDVAAPGNPCTLADRMRFVLPRLVEVGMDADGMDLPSLADRLRAERDAAGQAWFGDVAVAAWAVPGGDRHHELPR